MSTTLQAFEVSYQGSFLDLYFYSAESLNCQRGAHMLTVSLIQVGIAKMEKPLVRMGAPPCCDKTNVKRGLGLLRKMLRYLLMSPTTELETEHWFPRRKQILICS
ncbi:hypothetical protein AHAS_Ahas18G0196800 [Arachis hypogaea]